MARTGSQQKPSSSSSSASGAAGNEAAGRCEQGKPQPAPPREAPLPAGEGAEVGRGVRQPQRGGFWGEVFEKPQVRLVLATHSPPWEPGCLISPLNDSLCDSGRKNDGHLKLKGLDFFSCSMSRTRSKGCPSPAVWGWEQPWDCEDPFCPDHSLIL